MSTISVNGLPACNKCGTSKYLVSEKLPSQPTDGQETFLFFILCKNPDACGAPDGKGCRTLTNGVASAYGAEKAWREEASRHPFKEPS
jgi:hypothetical protein